VPLADVARAGEGENVPDHLGEREAAQRVVDEGVAGELDAPAGRVVPGGHDVAAVVEVAPHIGRAIGQRGGGHDAEEDAADAAHGGVERAVHEGGEDGVVVAGRAGVDGVVPRGQGVDRVPAKGSKSGP
jgi:hypothetical protein